MLIRGCTITAACDAVRMDHVKVRVVSDWRNMQLVSGIKLTAQQPRVVMEDNICSTSILGNKHLSKCLTTRIKVKTRSASKGLISMLFKRRHAPASLK